MNYEDILNLFAIKLNKALASQTLYQMPNIQLFLNNFDKCYNTNFLNIKAIENQKLFNTDNSSSILKAYDMSYEDMHRTYQRENENQESVLRFNLDNLDNNLKIKNHEIYESNVNLENKKRISKEKCKSQINDINIKRDLKKIELQNLVPDIKNKYNTVVSDANDTKNKQNNYIHSKASKELFIFHDQNSKKIALLTNQINDHATAISSIYDEIDTRTTLLDKQKLIYTQQYNQMVSSIKDKYNYTKNINNNQIIIEEQTLNKELDDITSLYQEKRADSLKQITQKFQNVDMQIDVEQNSYNLRKDKLYAEYAYQKYLQEKKYNSELYETNKKLKDGSINLKQQQSDSFASYKMFKKFDKIERKKISELDKHHSLILDNYKIEKNILDASRKYLIKRFELLEAQDKFEVNRKLELIKLEKATFDSQQDNLMESDISDEHLKYEQNILKIDTSHNEYEKKRQELIINQNRQKEIKETNKQYYTDMEDIQKEYHQKLDFYTIRHNDLSSTLIIEKNKHLVKFNEQNIMHHSKLLDLYYDYEIQNAKAELDKQSNRYSSSLKFNADSIRHFENYTMLLKENEKIEYKHKIGIKKLDDNLRININKNELHINKLKIDNSLISYLIDNSLSLITPFTHELLTLIDCLIKIDTTIDFITDNIRVYVNLFFEYFKNILKCLESNLIKIVDNHIIFEIGSKYDLLHLENENKYKEKTNQLIDLNNSATSTIENYNKILHRYYERLNALEIEKKNLLKKKSHSKVEDIEKEISDITKKINKNTSLIKSLEDTLNNLSVRQHRIDVDYNKVKYQLENDKVKEDAVSFLTIRHIQEETSSLLVEFRSMFDLFDSQKCDDMKNIKSDYLKLQKYLVLFIPRYKRNLNAIINKFYVHEMYELVHQKKELNIRHLESKRKLDKIYKKSKIQNQIRIESCIKDLNRLSSKYYNSTMKIDASYKENLILNQKIYNEKMQLQHKKYKNCEFDYFKIFNAFDENISSLSDDTIFNRQLIEKNRLISHKNNDNKLKKNIESANKNYKEKHAKLLKELNSIQVLSKKKSKDLDTQNTKYKIKNIMNNKELGIKLKLEQKMSNKKVSDNIKNTKALISKESKQYLQTKKALKRKFTFKQLKQNTLD